MMKLHGLPIEGSVRDGQLAKAWNKYSRQCSSSSVSRASGLYRNFVCRPLAKQMQMTFHPQC